MDRYETHCNPELTSAVKVRESQSRRIPFLSTVSGGARKDERVHRGANSREKKLSPGKNFPSAEFRFKGSLIRWKTRGFGWMLLKSSRDVPAIYPFERCTKVFFVSKFFSNVIRDFKLRFRR